MDIRSQRPKAGDIREQGTDQTLFLSPLPVYTGQPQAGRLSFSELNDTFLELGSTNRGMVWQGKLLAIMAWMGLSMAFIVPTLVIVYGVVFYPENFPDPVADWSLAIQAFSLYTSPFLIPLGACFHTVFQGAKALAKTYPVRFNRQRREVCCINDKTHRVLIVPWESVVAWVSNCQGLAANGMAREHTFGMVLEDEATDTVQFITLAQPSDEHALGLWAAIRNYMEKEQEAEEADVYLAMLGLTPTEDELKPYEGLHTFEVEKREKYMLGFLHREDDYAKQLGLKKTKWPLRRWYIRRVLLFWKMPYLLAEWGHRKGRPAMPEAVVAWSQPLPPEQWAQPSPALIKANAIVKNAMDKKKMTFVEACKAAGMQ